MNAVLLAAGDGFGFTVFRAAKHHGHGNLVAFQRDLGSNRMFEGFAKGVGRVKHAAVIGDERGGRLVAAGFDSENAHEDHIAHLSRGVARSGYAFAGQAAMSRP